MGGIVQEMREQSGTQHSPFGGNPMWMRTRQLKAMAFHPKDSCVAVASAWCQEELLRVLHTVIFLKVTPRREFHSGRMLGSGARSSTTAVAKCDHLTYILSMVNLNSPRLGAPLGPDNRQTVAAELKNKKNKKNDGKSPKGGPGGPGDLETARVKSPLTLEPLPGPPGLLSGSSA